MIGESKTDVCGKWRGAREPSYVCSVLDDAAARGDADALLALCVRWERKRGNAARLVVHAAHARAYAIKARLIGRIGIAIDRERDSEWALEQLAWFGLAPSNRPMPNVDGMRPYPRRTVRS